MPVPKFILHPVLTFIYRAYCAWLRFKGRPVLGTAVAVWHGAEVLVVRHSYRPGYSLPGGMLNRDEDPKEGACREIFEEVGVTIRPDELTLVGKDRAGLHDDYIYEYRPFTRPGIRIDNWEIVEARFVDPKAFGEGEYLVGQYLRNSCLNGSPETRQEALSERGPVP